MKKIVLVSLVSMLLSCSNHNDIKKYLEDEKEKVVNIIEVSERRNYIISCYHDTMEINNNVYSYRVKYSIGDNIYFDDVVFDKETNKPIALSSRFSR